MSRGDVVKAGHLTKSPPERPGIRKVAQWHRRWFVLSDSSIVYPLARRCVQLTYFHCEEDTRKMKDPKGRQEARKGGMGGVETGLTPRTSETYLVL